MSDLDASPTAELTAALQALAHFDAEASGTTLRVTRVDGTGDFRLQVVVTKTGAIAAARPAAHDHLRRRGRRRRHLRGRRQRHRLQRRRRLDSRSPRTPPTRAPSPPASRATSTATTPTTPSPRARSGLYLPAGLERDFTAAPARSTRPAAAGAAAGAETFTITGTINSGDTWQLLDGTTVLATTSAAATAAALLAALQAADTNSAYTAFVLGSTLYVTRSPAAPDTLGRRDPPRHRPGAVRHARARLPARPSCDPAGDRSPRRSGRHVDDHDRRGDADRAPAAGETTSQIIDRLVTALSGGGATRHHATAASCTSSPRPAAPCRHRPDHQFRPGRHRRDDRVRSPTTRSGSSTAGPRPLQLRERRTQGRSRAARSGRSSSRPRLTDPLRGLAEPPSEPHAARDRRGPRRTAITPARPCTAPRCSAPVSGASGCRGKFGANDPFTVTVIARRRRGARPGRHRPLPRSSRARSSSPSSGPGSSSSSSSTRTWRRTSRHRRHARLHGAPDSVDIRSATASPAGLQHRVAGARPRQRHRGRPVPALRLQPGRHVHDRGRLHRGLRRPHVLGVANTYRLNGSRRRQPGASYDLVVSLERQEINPERSRSSASSSPSWRAPARARPRHPRLRPGEPDVHARPDWAASTRRAASRSPRG